MKGMVMGMVKPKSKPAKKVVVAAKTSMPKGKMMKKAGKGKMC